MIKQTGGRLPFVLCRVAEKGEFAPPMSSFQDFGASPCLRDFGPGFPDGQGQRRAGHPYAGTSQASPLDGLCSIQSLTVHFHRRKTIIQFTTSIEHRRRGFSSSSSIGRSDHFPSRQAAARLAGQRLTGGGQHHTDTPRASSAAGNNTASCTASEALISSSVSRSPAWEDTCVPVCWSTGSDCR